VEVLTDELVRAVGLGGRDRKVGSAAERARFAVTKAIRAAVRRVAEHEAALGRHLDVSVRTGVFCLQPGPERRHQVTVRP
jgi:non-specific serine/threonine protein kinase